ncbi:MAG: DUF2243 domain-containing protein [Labedaea sp.]
MNNSPSGMARADGLLVPGLLLGLGLGGFVDGIVAHQLLEWHHMLSGWYPPDSTHHLRLNMIGDGLFHLACLVLVLVGIGLLVAAGPAAPPERGRRLAGWMIAGWGWFNLVEGLIDHHILGVHHVHPGPGQLGYDLGFLALGAVLVAVGTWLSRSRGFSRRVAGSTSPNQISHTGTGPPHRPA